MGLDMYLKKIPRTDFEKISQDDFWMEEYEKSEAIMYWRKKYEIDGYIRENTPHYSEEYCAEVTKEILVELYSWLLKENLLEDSIKIQEIIDNTDFSKWVIFYSYYN